MCGTRVMVLICISWMFGTLSGRKVSHKVRYSLMLSAERILTALQLRDKSASFLFKGSGIICRQQILLILQEAKNSYQNMKAEICLCEEVLDRNFCNNFTLSREFMWQLDASADWDWESGIWLWFREQGAWYIFFFYVIGIWVWKSSSHQISAYLAIKWSRLVNFVL